ncbi:MAG: DUF1343 domain-containing protein [Armatimonadota bacterium]
MAFAVGLDILAAQAFSFLRGKRVGVVCNQASVDSSYRHILELLDAVEIGAVFGPQHGLFGTTQDNMIEWNGEGVPRRPYPTYSLYGEHREPTDAMLAGLDLLLIDLPDVGSRYYTFIWTTSLCIKAAARVGLPVLVLDRPNPIGSAVEGPGIEPGFESFVGLYNVPIRHGKTIGEIARYVADNYHPTTELEVINVEGWDRTLHADHTPYRWVMPSPNMPTIDTAMVYPGGCLLEATNLSEGRGTTRPFEIVGAPFIDGGRLASALNGLGIEGAYFRALQFEPTFNKHHGKICEGVQVHILDRSAFRPVLAYGCLINEVVKQTGIHDSSHVKLGRFQATSDETQLPGFAWKQPPYEYVYDRMPIDILSGSETFRNLVESGANLNLIDQWTFS